MTDDEFKQARKAAKEAAKGERDKAIANRKKFLGYSRKEIKEAEQQRKRKRRKRRKTPSA